jgi:RNA polymerase sigma factor (sigma-70 family)
MAPKQRQSQGTADGASLEPTEEMLENSLHPGWVDLLLKEKGPYYRLAKHIAMKMGLDDHTAEDVFQEAAATLFRKLETPAFYASDLKDLPRFLAKLKAAADPISAYLRDHLSTSAGQAIAACSGTDSVAPELKTVLLDELNGMLGDRGLYDPERFSQVELRPITRELSARVMPEAELSRRNRKLLEDAFPNEIARRYDPTRGSFRSWFMKFVENKAWNVVKARQRHLTSPLDPEILTSDPAPLEGQENDPRTPEEIMQELLHQQEEDFINEVDRAMQETILQKAMGQVAKRVNPATYRIFVETSKGDRDYKDIGLQFGVTSGNVAKIRTTCNGMLQEETLRLLPIRRTLRQEASSLEERFKRIEQLRHALASFKQPPDGAVLICHCADGFQYRGIGQSLLIGRMNEPPKVKGRKKAADGVNEWRFPDTDTNIELSHYHFQICRQDGDYMLNDPPRGKPAPSTNGTWVNPGPGKQPQPRRIRDLPLVSGDQIVAGGIVFLFSTPVTDHAH